VTQSLIRKVDAALTKGDVAEQLGVSHRTITRLIETGSHVAGKDRDAHAFGDGTTPFRHSNYYRRVFRPAAAAVGLPTFHQLRHFYASVLLTNPTLSPVDIAKVLGHADANLLFNTYGHSFRDAGKDVGEWLDTLRSSPTPTGTAVPIRNATG
jgi:integrase